MHKKEIIETFQNPGYLPCLFVVQNLKESKDKDFAYEYRVFTLMVKELSMVSSTVLTLTWRISSERSSRAEIIFTA